ncbi:MAG: TetR/AcrR family transcriptional regulator, partial [Gordonia sp. (in: high G+C Gram-positive bacteria)]
DVAHRDGWNAVTMRRIADEIEYSANFAYRYFSGRDEILHELVRQGFERLRDVMAAASKQAGHNPSGTGGITDPADAVRRAGRAYLDFAIADPDLYQLMYGLGGIRVPATDAWTEGQAIGDIMTELLAAAGDHHADRHVLQLWATAHGLIALMVVGRVDADVTALHAVFDNAVTDCLTHVLASDSTNETTLPS